MDSKLSLSDSEIEDIFPEKDLVSFENIQKYYSPYSDIVASYTVGESFTADSRDWVGLFKSGWQDVSCYVDYKWASLDSFSHLLPRRRRVIFQAQGDKMNHEMSSFQFIYVSRDDHVIGVSNLFHILDMPKEPQLNFDLLEMALEDEGFETSESDTFSGKDMENPPENKENTWVLSQVANTSLYMDPQDTVVALYPSNKRDNSKMPKKEMPFYGVEDKQIVEFFNKSNPSITKSITDSWLHNILTKIQFNAEMLNEKEPNYDAKIMDQEMPFKEEATTTQEDKESLTRSFSENSWMDDLQIVDPAAIVNDFYNDSNESLFDFPAQQDSRESRVYTPPESPELLDFTEEDEKSCLENLFSNDDWVDLPGCELTNDTLKTTPGMVSKSKRNEKVFCDFTEELCLDILFHENEDNKKKKSGPKSKKPRRRYYKKTTATKVFQKSRKTRVSKAQRRNTEVRCPDVSTEETAEKSLALVPYKPLTVAVVAKNRTQHTPQPTEKHQNRCRKHGQHSNSKKSSFDRSMVHQPYLAAPIFLPYNHYQYCPPSIELVPFVPTVPFECRPLTKCIMPSKANTKFNYTVRGNFSSVRGNNGCYNCKSNRKLVSVYRERYSTAQKQLEQLLSERSTLQNQLNSVAEEVRVVKTESQIKSRAVEILTNKVDDLMGIIPDVETVIKNLEENNALLDMAFQSAVVDNAQLKTDTASIQTSLRELNTQFLETEAELKSAIRDIQARQGAEEEEKRENWRVKVPKKIEKLHTIISKREQTIESLQEHLINQSLQISSNNEEIKSLKASLITEHQRSDKAEVEIAELKTKMEVILARQSTSNQKQTWNNPVCEQPKVIVKQPAQYTVCNEVAVHARVPNSRVPMSSRTWKVFNDALKQEILEGSCRTCGMKFSPFVDKRIIEEHIAYHQQFKH